jgi:hypothetical protein
MSKLIKYTVEHYRKEGVSEEAFEKFFSEVHLATTLPLMKKYGFVKYTVVSSPYPGPNFTSAESANTVYP